MKTPKTPITWAKETCPYCGQQYVYIEGAYKPSTCGRFECLQQYLHGQLKGGDERRKNNHSSSKK